MIPINLDARGQAFRYKTEHPIRGYIYDRNKKLLVYNEAAYDLMILPKDVKDLDTTDFCDLLGITKEQFLKKIKKAKQAPNSPYRESIFEKQLSPKDYASFKNDCIASKDFGYNPEHSENILKKLQRTH
jgi:penicillin-binding protein 2